MQSLNKLGEELSITVARDPYSLLYVWLRRRWWQWQLLARKIIKIYNRGTRSNPRNEEPSERCVDAIKDCPAIEENYRLLSSAGRLGGESIVLFVTHAPITSVKGHVKFHLRALRQRRLPTVLIINSDPPIDEWVYSTELDNLADHVIIRNNIGYDFGAWRAGWMHLSSLDLPDPSRVLLVNDSIIGPLEDDGFDKILENIFSSSADVLGLTESYQPIHHLQSFFLVFQNRATVPGGFLSEFMKDICNLRRKEDVINLYETRLLQRLLLQRLEYKALFPAYDPTGLMPNDPWERWYDLLQDGFPYLKVSVVKDKKSIPLIAQLASHSQFDDL